MPFTFTAAPSSRISKPRKKKPLLTRSLSSPFQTLPRRKPIERAQSKPEIDTEDDLFGDRLDDRGLIVSLAGELSLRDVPQTMKYICSHMFDALPEKTGMNSIRIAEVLNFRKSLPPIVTTAHIHAFLKSPTDIEREIAELAAAGVVRKIIVPGRGSRGSSIGDALVFVQDWRLIVDKAELDPATRAKYIAQLSANSLASKIPQRTFSTAEAAELMGAGFLTASSATTTSTNLFRRSDSASLGTLTSLASISKAASGSMAAVGGAGAVHDAGGGGSAGLQRREPHSTPSDEPRASPKYGETFHLALPSTGLFLKLLAAARSHLLSLLSKSKYKEAPEPLLRERWDGGVAAEGSVHAGSRKELVIVLPGRTRKWKQFYGLRFEWILAECVGAGLVEVFETGSVGRGVRAI